MSKNKKPLIIDGINVSKCCYVIDYDPPEGQGTWGGAIHKGACRVYSKDCKYNPNCHFKQLARKTQECDIWKNQVLILDEEDVTVEVTQEQFEEYQKLKQQCKQLKEDYAELERECERLKSYGATLLADKNATEIGRDDYRQRCKRLEQECEELKEKNKVLQKLVSELEYSVQVGIELDDRYCKALEEIETELSLGFTTMAFYRILDIINKAKG